MGALLTLAIDIERYVAASCMSSQPLLIYRPLFSVLSKSPFKTCQSKALSSFCVPECPGGISSRAYVLFICEMGQELKKTSFSGPYCFGSQ